MISDVLNELLLKSMLEWNNLLAIFINLKYNVTVPYVLGNQTLNTTMWKCVETLCYGIVVK